MLVSFVQPSELVQFSSVQFSRSVVSDSLRPHESQLTRPPCPSPTPGVHSDSHPSSQWWQATFVPELLEVESSLLMGDKYITGWSSNYLCWIFQEKPTWEYMMFSLSVQCNFLEEPVSKSTVVWRTDAYTHMYPPTPSRTITQNWIQLLGTLWPTTFLILQPSSLVQHKLSNFPILGDLKQLQML